MCYYFLCRTYQRTVGPSISYSYQSSSRVSYFSSVCRWGVYCSHFHLHQQNSGANRAQDPRSPPLSSLSHWAYASSRYLNFGYRAIKVQRFVLLNSLSGRVVELAGLIKECGHCAILGNSASCNMSRFIIVVAAVLETYSFWDIVLLRRLCLLFFFMKTSCPVKLSSTPTASELHRCRLEKDCVVKM